MRVLINRLTALRQKSGVGHYTHQLLTALQEITPPGTLAFFPGKGAELFLNWRGRGRRGGGGKKGENAKPKEPAAWKAGLGRWLNTVHFRLFNAIQSFDLYHEPNAIALPCGRPTVLTVHDLSLLLYPQWHPAERVRHFARNFEKGLDNARHVLTGTEAARREILQHLGVSPQKVTCHPYGVSPHFRPLPAEDVRSAIQRLGLPASYLLFVGTLEPRKNLKTLLQAYCDLPESVRAQCPLILAGGWGWNTADLAEYFNTVARHRGVHHLGYVTDADLPALYNGARALVIPSFYEGFGLPPLEMLACGGAVLSSTAGALVEVVGKKAHLVEPRDLEGWRDALKRIITEKDWHRDLCRGASDYARTFTWRRCAEGTLSVYRQVLGIRDENRIAA